MAIAAATAVTTNAITFSTQEILTESPAPTPNTPVGDTPCGVRSDRPLRYAHVIVIMMENHDGSQVIGSSRAPFQNQLAAQCGLAANYSAVGSPALSLPNYLALTSGTALGGRYAARCEPITCNTDAVNIFSQLAQEHKSWKAYEESMRVNCELRNDGRYAVRHNPPPYYSNLDGTCLTNDVPLGSITSGHFIGDLAADKLPDFAFVTPNLCNDTHDCPVSTGDAWLRSWVTKILASPAYQAGNTALFITYDEGDKTNFVPALIVAPSVPAGTRSDVPFNHYSLLRTMQQLLGLSPYLENAGNAASMRSAFRL